MAGAARRQRLYASRGIVLAIAASRAQAMHRYSCRRRFCSALHGLEPSHFKTMMAAFIIRPGHAGAGGPSGDWSRPCRIPPSCGRSRSCRAAFRQWSNETTSRISARWPRPSLDPGVAGWMFWRMRRDAHEAHHDRQASSSRHDHDHGHGHGHDLCPRCPASRRNIRRFCARAHAADIQRRFANRQATTTRLSASGLTGGLVPPGFRSRCCCSACSSSNRARLRHARALLRSDSVATMVAVGALALSVRITSRRMERFAFARRALCAVALITLLGLYTFWSGSRNSRRRLVRDQHGRALRSRPSRRSAEASLASTADSASRACRCASRPDSARNSRRLHAWMATKRPAFLLVSSAWGNAGMSLMWMPPPVDHAAALCGTESRRDGGPPTGARR